MVWVAVIPTSGWMSVEPVSPRGRDGRDAGRRVDEAVVPERGAAVGVEGVNAVVLRGDVDHVDRRRLAGDGDARDGQRLGVDVAVDRVGVELAEGGRVDVGRRQRRLGGVHTRQGGDAIVVRQHVTGREQHAVLKGCGSGPERLRGTGIPGAHSPSGISHWGLLIGDGQTDVNITRRADNACAHGERESYRVGAECADGGRSDGQDAVIAGAVGDRAFDECIRPQSARPGL